MSGPYARALTIDQHDRTARGGFRRVGGEYRQDYRTFWVARRRYLQLLFSGA